MNDKNFIEAIFLAIKDKGVKAAFRRADSSRLNFQCIAFLIKHGIAADDFNERTAALTVMASIARSKFTQNGTVPFGQAISLCYPDRDNSDSAVLKMRKVCSCENVQELSTTLRPLLGLISGRNINLDYVSLYRELRLFKYESQRENIRINWMKNFYGLKEE